MKILYLHGYGSSGQSSTVEYLKKSLPDYYHIEAPDIPVDPAEALPFLKHLCEEKHFSVIIGTSMGGMYAHQLPADFVRICVNPALHLSEITDVMKVGTFDFFQPRKDGQTQYTITEEIIRHYREMEAHQFDGWKADAPENILCIGLFGTRDTTVNCRDEFARYYPNVQTFDGEHRMNQKVVKNVVLPIIRKHLATYKKNDILLFMTSEPQAHVCEMFGGEAVEKEDVEREPYYGFVKSVISASKGIYLMQTIKPMEGFVCIAEKTDIIRVVDKNELPEAERERKSTEWLEAPNVYVPAQNTSLSGLSEEERCIALAKEALVHLFPEIPTTEFELRDNWFSKASFISTLNHFDEYWETTIKNSKREKELVLLKNEILKDIQTARFKEYYTVKVGTPIENGTAYFIVAVSKEFDEACVLLDLTERSNFFRSLGPEFNDVEDEVDHYRNRLMSVINKQDNETN